jgi:hypothetical protein
MTASDRPGGWRSAHEKAAAYFVQEKEREREKNKQQPTRTVENICKSMIRGC